MKRLKCDCEQCPLAWEERGYDDWDAGCHFYDDLYENKFVCFLPRFIKKLLLKRQLKLMDKQYEGMDEWFREEERKDNALRQALREVLFEDSVICYKNEEGKLLERNTERLLFYDTFDIRLRYEELLSETKGDKRK
ncbi:MAG: hypothetical protein IJN92_09495 [Lachnospiraceae bacterium]|nr:hypothetical protein [Lachnospiraceae bacterium]